MNISCTRKLHFSAGHRLMGQGGKCEHLHGHNYNIEITAQAYGHLDEIGRVVDFSVIKQVYDPWIQREWDHGFLLHVDDNPGKQAMQSFMACIGAPAQKFSLYNWNPTAENISCFLGTASHFVQALAQYQVKVIKVVCHETQNCSAEWSE